MTKAKIALLVALIFLAGGVAGAGIASAWKPARATPPPPGPRGPERSEDFQKRIFSRMIERLQLTTNQVTQIEPVFRKGWEDVHAIQDRSIKEVEAAVKRNHEEIGKLVTLEQRQKLEEMDREREKRHHHRGPGPGGPPPGGGGPGFPLPNDRPDKKENAP
jgi:Spy/CpxP family protein refolding chaperone